MNRVTTAPAQSRVTAEPQQVVTPLSGRTGGAGSGGAGLVELGGNLEMATGLPLGGALSNRRQGLASERWLESSIVRQTPRPGCGWCFRGQLCRFGKVRGRDVNCRVAPKHQETALGV